MSGGHGEFDFNLSHREKIEFMLEREGWAIDAVPATTSTDPPIPTYAYTVGFQDRFGFPEVCLFGLTPVASRGLFGMLADALAGGTELPVDAVFMGLLDAGQRCALLTVDPATNAPLFPALVEHRQLAGGPGDDFAMVQLTWPDHGGVLPWEPGYEARLAPVQLLIADPPPA